MSSVIQNLIQSTLKDGARSTKFECVVLFASPVFSGGDMAVLVKTSQFPGKSHDVIDFKYKGRSIPLKGQTKYDNTWTCTFYLTEDHELKKGFEDWIESLDQQHNIKDVSYDVWMAQNFYKTSEYTSTMSIYQLDFTGENQRVAYHMMYAFPKSVSMIEVDYSAVGTLLEYTVEFSYAYYDTENMLGTDGNFIDGLKNKALKGAKGFVDDLRERSVTVLKDKGSSLYNDYKPASLPEWKLGGSLNSTSGRKSALGRDAPVIIGVSGINTNVSI